MKETNLTIEQIEDMLVGHPDSPFYIRQNIVIPNVAWGYLNHEADLLIESKSHYLTEVEIKRTWKDFIADFKKKHTHSDPKLSHFYYAVPESIKEKVFRFLYNGEMPKYSYYKAKVEGPTEFNPHECGIIFYEEPSDDNPRPRCRILVPSKRIGDYAISEKEELKLLRLCGMRVWALKNKVAKLQGKIKEQ